jgi:septation ring formation regulator EzrA
MWILMVAVVVVVVVVVVMVKMIRKKPQLEVVVMERRMLGWGCC